jgi:glycosyltransferase involved in cell wall biosynthesis
LPSNTEPTGGFKVIYRQIEIICAHGIDAMAFHPEKPGQVYSWFVHDVKTLLVGHMDPRTDFLVFPEIWAALAAEFCIPAGLKYAVYVQNGYLVHTTAGFAPMTVQRAYEQAALVLSISADTTRVLSMSFPSLRPERMLRLSLSVPSFFVPGKKERLITYMPRKLPGHSQRLAFFLRNVLETGWKLQPIENVDERAVAELMARSAIFLSFSELEGYGLPPIEAALAGNIVVGYTGEGGKEFFAPPIFRPVESGDFLSFVAQMRTAIEDVERGLPNTESFLQEIASLAKAHSAANETASVMRFVERVRGVMAPMCDATPMSVADTR